jgi:hypothetical protein
VTRTDAGRPVRATSGTGSRRGAVVVTRPWPPHPRRRRGSRRCPS